MGAGGTHVCFCCKSTFVFLWPRRQGEWICDLEATSGRLDRSLHILHPAAHQIGADPARGGGAQRSVRGHLASWYELQAVGAFALWHCLLAWRGVWGSARLCVAWASTSPRGRGQGAQGGAPHPPLRTSKSCHVIFRGDFLEGLRPAVAPGSARWCAGLCARANFGPIFLHGKLDACLAPSNHSAHIQHTPKTPQPCRARCAGALRRRARGHGVGRDARAPLARAQRLCGRATDMPAPPTLAPCRERVAARARPVTRRVRDAAVPWSVAVARRGSWWWLGAH